MQRRARVVHVVVAGQPAGAERMLVDLASRPQVSRAEHALALMTPNEKVRALFRGAGLRVYDRGPVRENPVAYLRMSLGPTMTAWVAGVLREERADVAHLHTFASHVVGTRAARREGVRILRTEHDTHYFADPSCSPFTRWSLRRTDAVVAVSEHVREYVERTAPYVRDKLTVIRNGVDAEKFSPRPELAPNEGPIRFVLACRLEPRKQPHVVLRAVARVPGAELDVLGDGSMRPMLERLVGELGVRDRVRIHGYSPDPASVIARADAAISGARHEPLGLSVLEALSMAKPVVAFAVGGIPEIVTHRKTGWLVHDISVGALARALGEAASDRTRLRAMGDAARAFVMSQCRVENMCEAYGAAYDELLRR
jgi:glycosyltransferase involved in cell wall biosynthesis